MCTYEIWTINTVLMKIICRCHVIIVTTVGQTVTILVCAEVVLHGAFGSPNTSSKIQNIQETAIVKQFMVTLYFKLKVFHNTLHILIFM